MSNVHTKAGGAARGSIQLVFDAIVGVAQIVEGMHANIGAGSLPLGKGTDGRTRGISRLVYEGIRQTNHGAAWLLDGVLRRLEQMAVTERELPQPQWDAALGALNGVLGDHLVEQENPLAIPMQLRPHGHSPRLESAAKGRKILVLVHGLCMNDRLWNRDDHDHGEALAQAFDYEPTYLFYNTGRHVSENGREFARLLEDWVSASPTPVDEITILAHSMGGLVTRSACEIAESEGYSWRRPLRKIVFLGTPHHGAPMERIGNWVHSAASLSPYLAPLTNLAFFRSAGISDLRHGNLLDQDWQSRETESDRRDLRRPVPLPKDVDCYAVAARLSKEEGKPGLELVGDGLVPIESAFGRHPDPTRALCFSEDRQWMGVGMSHFDLVSRPEVYAVIRDWLSE